MAPNACASLPCRRLCSASVAALSPLLLLFVPPLPSPLSTASLLTLMLPCLSSAHPALLPPVLPPPPPVPAQPPPVSLAPSPAVSTISLPRTPPLTVAFYGRPSRITAVFLAPSAASRFLSLPRRPISGDRQPFTVSPSPPAYYLPGVPYPAAISFTRAAFFPALAHPPRTP